jgi:hypothetical protein
MSLDPTTWPLGLIGVLIFGGLLLAWEIGARLDHTSGNDSGRDAANGYIISGVFGLLALLIAFTFGMALDRYETRRSLVVSEANAIGTAEMRVRLLPAPDGPQLSTMFRDYAATRLHFGLVEAREKAPLVRASEALREQIQDRTLTAVEPIRTTPLASLIVSAVNDAIDVGAEREAAHAARLPVAVLLVLIVFATVAAGVLGFAVSGSSRSHRVVSGLMFLLLALSLAMILDLDRARGGFIQVSQEPMLGLIESFTPPATRGSQP